MRGRCFDRCADVAVTGGAELALFKLQHGLYVRRVGTMAQGALSALERRMHDLLLQEIALVGVTHQAKIRDFLSDVEGSLRLGIHMTGAAACRHAGMNRVAQNLRLAGAVRRMTIRAAAVGHRIAAVRLGNIRRREIMALLAERLDRLDQAIGFACSVRIVAIGAALNDRRMIYFFAEVLFLVACETKIVAGFFEQPLVVRGVRVVAARAADPLFRRVLEGRVQFRLLQLLFLRSVAGVTKLGAFLFEYDRADDAMAFVASFAFRFAHRGMDEFLRSVSLALLLMAVHACFGSEASRRRHAERRSEPLPQDRAGQKYRGKDKRYLQELAVHTVRPIHASVPLSDALFPRKRPRLYRSRHHRSR